MGGMSDKFFNGNVTATWILMETEGNEEFDLLWEV